MYNSNLWKTLKNDNFSVQWKIVVTIFPKITENPITYNIRKKSNKIVKNIIFNRLSIKRGVIDYNPLYLVNFSSL